MTDHSFDYFRSRAEQERIAADRASDERAAQSHRELAEHYEKLANGSEQPALPAPAHGAGIVSNDFRIIP
jgi:pyridoxine/pyridoxamine 5'-phosphate oxidase